MAFTHYSPLTSDDGLIPNTDQTNFPTLIDKTDVRFATIANGGRATSATGYDIRPHGNSDLVTSPLDFRLDYYNATTGQVIMRVRIPTLPHASDLEIYLAVGDSGLSSDASSDAVWNANCAMALPLNEASSPAVDGTANNNDGTQAGGVTFGATGKVHLGCTFDGVDNEIHVADANSIGAQRPMSVEAWFKRGSTSTNQYILYKRSSNNAAGWGLILSESLGEIIRFTFFGIADIDSSGTIADTNFHHVAVTVAAGGGVVIYIDGASAGTGTMAAEAPDDNGSLFIAAHTDGAVPDIWSAQTQDESRVWTAALSADWVASMYANENNPATFWTLGTEVAVGGGATNMLLHPGMDGMGSWKHPAYAGGCNA